MYFHSEVAGPTHAMLLFRFCEDTFDCFLTFSIQSSIHVCMSEMIDFVHRFLPEMTEDDMF